MSAALRREMAQRMLDAAAAFYQAGQRCSVPIALSPVHTVSLGAPPIVCYAFAIELYLKLLILLTTGRQARGHVLLVLYRQLNASTCALCAAHFIYPDREDLLREAIAGISTTFEDWRYAHEKTFLATSFDSFERVGRSLHKAVSVIDPDLVSVFDRGPITAVEE
jgi:hypothetical protein